MVQHTVIQYYSITGGKKTIACKVADRPMRKNWNSAASLTDTTRSSSFVMSKLHFTCILAGSTSKNALAPLRS